MGTFTCWKSEFFHIRKEEAFFFVVSASRDSSHRNTVYSRHLQRSQPLHRRCRPVHAACNQSSTNSFNSQTSSGPLPPPPAALAVALPEFIEASPSRLSYASLQPPLRSALSAGVSRYPRKTRLRCHDLVIAAPPRHNHVWNNPSSPAPTQDRWPHVFLLL